MMLGKLNLKSNLASGSVPKRSVVEASLTGSGVAMYLDHVF